LHRLLVPAAEEGVNTFDGLMAPGLWDETFPGWRTSENDQPEYVTRQQRNEQLAMMGEP